MRPSGLWLNPVVSRRRFVGGGHWGRRSLTPSAQLGVYGDRAGFARFVLQRRDEATTLERDHQQGVDT